VSKGNGRLVRNMVEAAIARQTNRVFSLGTVSRGGLTTLLEEDFTAPADPGESSSIKQAADCPSPPPHLT
ncbi:MAG: hypothetical protein SGPRY_007232, partial [Prymnesium sp.]